MNINNKKWAFFSYGHNLGDFTRAVETAVGMQDTGAEVKFFNHGSVHLDKITNRGLNCINLQPELTWEQHHVIMDINRYKVPVGTPIPVTKEEWIAMAESDLKAFDDFKPDGVYAGLSLSCMISVPYAKLPMVTQVPTVNCPAFIENEMYNMPNFMEKNFITRHVIPGWLKRKLMKRILMGDAAKASVVTFNEARKKFGLPPIYNIVDLVRGDVTLLPDLPEMSGLAEEKLTPGYYYTGPIFAQFDMPIPKEVGEVFSRPGLNIFVSLGSSGFPETLQLVINTLRKNPEYNIVCSTTTIIDPKQLGENNERFFATRFMPTHLVNEMADIAFLHGGQGTIQTAVWAGTPVVGIGFQAEQQANIDGIAKQGMAVRIPLYGVSANSIKKSIIKVSSEKCRKNAKRMQKLVRSSNGVVKSVEIMNKFVDGIL
ncbi:MAG: hypothetical protein MI922_29255 [Bacteroidales bacterium]|nr:hypothetical protein [Bacteroidales bacterium]